MFFMSSVNKYVFVLCVKSYETFDKKSKLYQIMKINIYTLFIYNNIYIILYGYYTENHK